MTLGSTTCGKLLNIKTYNVIVGLCGQLEDWIVCISLTTYTCNVWRNMLTRICQSIRCNFRRSVDTSILTVVFSPVGCPSRPREECCPQGARTGRPASGNRGGTPPRDETHPGTAQTHAHQTADEVGWVWLYFFFTLFSTLRRLYQCGQLTYLHFSFTFSQCYEPVTDNCPVF